MAPNSKASVSRRKSAGGKSLIITLHVSPERLRDLLDEPTSAKEETPAKDTPEEVQEPKAESKEPNGASESPADDSNAQPTPVQANGDNASDSNPATPAANGEGTPAPGTMGPPTEGPKKKGTKRSAGPANGVGPDGQPKIRGKPGPKKKARLEDGTIDPNAGGRGGAAAHKLGPKANQGAINAGLRALDRSGAPCRRWAKGSFVLKSFTGVTWEIPRWTAPPKSASQPPSDESASASAENSTKENVDTNGTKLDNGAEKSDVNSTTANSAADVEMRSGPPSAIAASSPAPVPISAA